MLNEFWRDALGGEWVCTVAGTPGTWKQIRPAAVAADPGSGTIPTGYSLWADASAKVGFHGATPTIQAAHIPDLDGGTTVDAEARAAIEAILVALGGKGLVAGS